MKRILWTLLLCAAPARAADQPHELSLDVGAALPFSDVSVSGGGSAKNGKTGPRLGLRYLYALRPALSAGAELGLEVRGTKSAPGLIANGDSEVGGTSFVALGVVRWMFKPESARRPYIIAGVGLHSGSTMIRTKPRAGFVWTDTGTNEQRELVNGTGTGFAAALRAGIELSSRGPGFFSLEGGLSHLGSAKYGATAAGRTAGLDGLKGSITNMTVTGRFGFKFG